VFPDIAEDIDIYEHGASLPLDFPLSTTFNTIAPAFEDPSFLKDYDAVIAHKDLSEILAYRAKKKYGTNFIWYMHNTSDLLYRSQNMPLPIQAISKTLGNHLRRLDEKAFNNADNVFTNSEYTIHDVVEPDFGQSNKVEALYPPIRNLSKSERQKDYALVLSRVAPSKNIELALQEMRGSEEKLKIAGGIKSKDYKNMLERKAESLDVEVEYLGFVPDKDLGKVISDAKFGIFTQKGAHFGLVPLEMIHTGTPCFVPSDTGAAEILPSSYHLPIQEIPKIMEEPQLNRKHYTRLREAVSP
jgi:glycosyltransferase involved in cell wall biosynthesis